MLSWINWWKKRIVNRRVQRFHEILSSEMNDILLNPCGVCDISLSLMHMINVSLSEPLQWWLKWYQSLFDIGCFSSLTVSSDFSLIRCNYISSIFLVNLFIQSWKNSVLRSDALLFIFPYLSHILFSQTQYKPVLKSYYMKQWKHRNCGKWIWVTRLSLVLLLDSQMVCSL